MNKKTSISLDKNCYLFAVKYGKRNEYVKKLIEDKIKKIGDSLFFLRQKYGKDEIVELIENISLPVGKWEKKSGDISPVHKADLVVLWEETILTGLTAKELLETLDKHW